MPITFEGTKELYESLNRSGDAAMSLVKDATDKGRTLSRHLETVSPTESGDKSGLDAYGRLLREAGIVTHSDPEAGYWASKARAFVDGGVVGRLLLTEFFARNWRKVSMRAPGSNTRAVFLSSDGTPGSWQRPYADAMDPRWDQEIAAAIPLSELIARTEPIEGQDYRSFYMTYDAAQLRRFRIGESAEIPIAILSDSERTINLKKYGRGLQASYEQLGRMRVDKLAMFIRFEAIQSEKDKVDAALDILINGDGNSGTAATTDTRASLDSSASAGELTLRGWLAFKKQFDNPYFINTGLMQKTVATDLELLNTGSANIPLVTVQGMGAMGTISRINQTADAVRYGWLSTAPATKIVGFQSTRALEQITMIGGEISETERFITNQTQVLTMTEWQGFATLDPNAVRIYDFT